MRKSQFKQPLSWPIVTSRSHSNYKTICASFRQLRQQIVIAEDAHPQQFRAPARTIVIQYRKRRNVATDAQAVDQNARMSSAPEDDACAGALFLHCGSLAVLPGRS